MLEHSHVHLSTAAFVTQPQSWGVATKSMWITKP